VLPTQRPRRSVSRAKIVATMPSS